MSIGGYHARRRLAALAMLVLVVVALWLGPVTAYLDFIRSGAEQVAEQRLVLERYRTLARVPLAENPQTSSPPVMLPELPEAQTIAMLQETVKNAALTANVQVQSLQVLRTEALSSAVKLGVRISATGQIAEIARMLFALEADRPVLYPDNLQIQSRPSAPGKSFGALDFQLDVSGFKPGAPS